MKKKSKINISILMALLIFFTLSSLIINDNLIFNMGNRNNNSEHQDNVNLDIEKLKLSKIAGKIHIINNSGWADFRNDGNCTGSGTYSDPYVIEDLVIDGGGSGSCIWIENSDVHFRIENCTLYYSGRSPNAGIRLDYVNNSQVIDNNYSSNVYGNMIGFYFGIRLLNCNNNTISGNTVNKNDYGMALYYCSNNTISRNTANNNHFSGIDLGHSDNNIISGNTANYNGVGIGLVSSSNNTISENAANNNSYCGIYLSSSSNHTLSGNIMNECGLLIYGTIEALVSNDIDTTNLVNEKPLYYYTNEIDLTPNNFTNAGQVILVNCNDSFLSNLNISYTHYAISLDYCNNNTISGNTVNNNYGDGIHLWYSDNNTISGNTANYNGVGIYLGYSDNNIISGNTANYNYGDGIRISFSDIKTISGNNASYNDDGIVLSYSSNTNISGNTVNNNDYGIYLARYNYSTISGNIVGNNSVGIMLLESHNNTVSGNILLGNEKCIEEENCEGNVFENNFCVEGDGISFELFIIISVISGGAVIIVTTLIFIRHKRIRK